MKDLKFLFAVLFSLPLLAQAQQNIRVTPFSRDWLLSTNAAEGRTKLGVGGGTGDALYTDFNTYYFRTNLSSGGIVGIATNKTLPHWVNVQDPPYSAAANGSTDATTAIQTALNFAQSQTRPYAVYIPAGLYRITTGLTVTNSNVVIFGDGMANSVIRVTASGIGQAFLVNNSAARLFNVHFNGLRIEATNALASPPDGIKLANTSQSSVQECQLGEKLAVGVRVDASEWFLDRHNIYTTGQVGLYGTVQDVNGFSNVGIRSEHSLWYQTTNAGVRIDGSSAKSVFRDGWIESTQRGFDLLNRATTDVEIDQLTVQGMHFQNLTGAGFDGGRFIAGTASGVTNYFILQHLAVLDCRANTFGASNAVEFIKGSNTNTATAAHDMAVRRSMFANVTVSAVYSDASTVNGEISQLWVQGGLPETTGAAQWIQELYPAGLRWRDTNNIAGTLLTRTSGNNVQLWTFTTNSGMDFVVFDSTKGVAGDIGNDGNDFAFTANLLTLNGGIIATNYGRFNSLAATNSITLNGNDLWALTPGANMSFTTNTGTKVLAINSTGGGGGTNGTPTFIDHVEVAGGPSFNSDTNIQFALSGTNTTANATNMARLNSPNNFTGANILTNLGNTISGNGAGLTNLNASNLASGTVADARLSASVSLLGQSISETEFAFTDVTTSNATTSTHGLMPKLSGNTNVFFDGAGNQFQVSLLGIKTNGAATTKFMGFDGTVVSWQTPSGSGDMVKANSNLVTGSVLYQMPAAQVTSTNIFIDSNTNIVTHAITTNFALVFTNWANNTGEKEIQITEDATGGHPPAFESTVLFENSPSTTHATAPSFPTNAGVSYTLWAFRRNGTNWIRGPSTVALSAATTSALFGTGVGTDPAFRAIADADIPNTITIDLAAVATVANTSVIVDGTDATSFVVIVDSATGNLALKTDAGIPYAADTGTLNPTVLTESGNAVPNATDHLGFFAATTSAQLAGVLSNESGTGAALFSSDSTQTNTTLITPKDATFTNLTATTLNVENADTTLARSSAGNVSIEGNVIYRAGGTDVAVADGGTGLSSGTSGGVLGYTASGTLASSAALAANAIVIGGGAGATPTTTTTGTGVLTALGLAVDGSGPLVLATGANLTNIVVTGQTNTDLTASLPVFTDSTKKLTSTGTIDGGSANVTLKWTDYDKFITPSLADEGGAIINTNNAASELWGHATFSGSGATNANWIVYEWVVPDDIDTAVDLKVARFKYTTAGTSTSSITFNIGMQDMADSADQLTISLANFSNWVVMTSSPTSTAANDGFTISAQTLTTWKSSLTAGHTVHIMINRDGAGDANNDAVTDKFFVIQYGRTQ